MPQPIHRASPGGPHHRSGRSSVQPIGRTRWLVRPRRGAGRAVGQGSTGRDRRLRELELSHARLTSLVSLSADWIWEQDADGRMTYISEGVTAATGLDPRQLIGLRRENFCEFDATPEALATYKARLASREPFRNFSYGQRRPDGSPCWIRISGEPLRAPDGRFMGYRGVGSDVTAATLAALELQHVASHDGLTGLPNRSTFMNALELALQHARRRGEGFALCFIDLDGFKGVNDDLGHAAGDELLKCVARRLSARLRGADLVARLGGDEFVALLECDADGHTAAPVGGKLLAAVAEPFMLAGRRFQASASVGMALHPAHGDDAATLLHRADAAMYAAKAAGGNHLRVYEPG